MPSKRSGLSEPRLYNLPPLRIGARVQLRVGDCDQKRLAMISAIVSIKGDSTLLLLITPQSEFPKLDTSSEDVTLVRAPGYRPIVLGSLLSEKDPLSTEVGSFGFRLIKLSNTDLFKASLDATRELSFVKGFRDCLWGQGVFRVRRVNPTFAQSEGTAGANAKKKNSTNKAPRIVNVRGRVSGEVEDVKFGQSDDCMQFPYCALVTRGGKRKIGDASALGAPLISQNGALAAVIVGSSDNEVLVLPYEEIQKRGDIEFRSFGEDWPKVLLKG